MYNVSIVIFFFSFDTNEIMYLRSRYNNIRCRHCLRCALLDYSANEGVSLILMYKIGNRKKSMRTLFDVLTRVRVILMASRIQYVDFSTTVAKSH